MDSRQEQFERLNQIVKEHGSGFNTIDELIHTSKSYSDLIPVLIDLLKSEVFSDLDTRGAIVRALTVKEARKTEATDVMIKEYNELKDKDGVEYGWELGNAIGFTMGSQHADAVIKIVKNKNNGASRQMLVHFMSRLKNNEKVVDVLIDLVNDKDVTGHALRALGNLRAEKARAKIESRTNDPWPFFRKEAKNALAKLDKAKAKAR
jgi:HEAT repeat protein